MIWLIGNKGMLGSDVEVVLKSASLEYISSDIDVDICDISQLRSFPEGKDISWIINCSAYTAVDQAEDEQDKAFAVNAEGAGNIAQMAKGIGARLIHISTDYVFDGDAEDGYSEEDPTSPQGVYGARKLQGEVYIAQACSDYFILRIAWLYGRYGKNFVYTMLRLFRERDEVRVVSDQHGSPTWSRDVAQVILAIIIANSKDYGIYHYTNEGRITWYDFAVKIYELGRTYGFFEKETSILPICTDEYPTRAKRPANSYLFKSKIKKTFSVDLPEWDTSLDSFIVDVAGITRRTVRWEQYSEYDFSTANDLFDKGKYIYSLFFCQQSVEKLLKSIIEFRKLPPRIHNIRRLLDIAELYGYNEYIELVHTLDLYYIETRYAEDLEVMKRDVTKEATKNILSETGCFLEWIKTKKKFFL